MFDWFKNKGKESNVIPFPEPKALPTTPYIDPPEKPEQTFYRLGITDNNRVSFAIGHSELTMNQAGVNNLIKQLEVFRDQLDEIAEE